MKRTLTIFLLFFLGMQISFAQGKTITGKVTSTSDGSTIPGVQIIVKGTMTGTTTNVDGTYSLTVPQSAAILQFSFIGMKTTDVEIGNQTVINLAMEEDLLLLDEVIVVAYGSAKKGTFTGSASQINADKIESRPLTNVTKAIEGLAAGVQVNAGSGQPGAGQDIRIRGIGSYSSDNSPLYVVDGMPFEGSLSSINATDIESLTVLKDASSTALYGSRAANGVVLLTTKKGKKGAGQLTVDVSHGFVSRSQPEYDLVGPDDYYELLWEARRNGNLYKSNPMTLEAANLEATNKIVSSLGYNPYNVANDAVVGTDGKINPSAKLLYPEDLDWMGYIMKPGSRDNYDFSYSGANEKADFYASLGYLNENGWIIESNFKRLTGRINANYQATSWLKTGLNISLANSKADQAQTGGSSNYVNPVRFTRGLAPIYPIHEHDATGAYVLDEAGNKVFDIYDHRAGGASPGRHAIAELLWDSDLDEITSISGKTYADVKLTKDLMFKSNFGWDQRNFLNRFSNNKFIGDGAPGGRIYKTFTTTTTMFFNQLLTYNKTFDKHNLTVLAGHESHDWYYDRISISKTQQILDGNIEMDNYVNYNGMDGRVDKYRLESYLSRIDYDYDGKYFFTASYRSDGSSRFSESKRWGDFYSLGASWRIDQETFVQDIKWINMLKLRSAYGQTGNDRLGSFYPYQSLYSLGFNNQAEAGMRLRTLPAENLVWESNNSFDLAVEFGLFNKVFGSIEYYTRATNDMLFEVPVPGSSGFTSKNENIGQLVNNGIEFSIAYDVIKTQDFTWNVNLNASTIHNEFRILPQEEIIDGSKKLMVGRGIYDFWLKEWYGVNPDNGEALYRADAVDGPGVFVVAGTKDTVTPYQNNARYHYAGSSLPDVYGSVTNTLTYKDFEFRFMFTYGIGGKIIDYGYQGIMNSGYYGASLSPDIKDRWQKPGDITNVPRLDVNRRADFEATSDRWLTDASYLALRQATISYNLPKSLLDKIGVSSARAYCSGENLFLLSARKGMNINQNFAGTTSNVYTPSRVITLGLNVKF